MRMARSRVIIGVKYNKLIPLERVGTDKHGLILFRCICDCGNEKIVGSRHITDGRIKSCGCDKGRYTKTITYKSWMSAKQRCFNKSNHNYSLYGKRGITMCSRWVISFNNFLKDMGERPSKDYTLDRKDVNGDYCPENCRWATHKEQSNNTRSNKYIEFNGEKMTYTNFANRFNINRNSIYFYFRKYKTAENIIKHIYEKSSLGTGS